jgi:hypothetical protein
MAKIAEMKASISRDNIAKDGKGSSPRLKLGKELVTV